MRSETHNRQSVRREQLDLLAPQDVGPPNGGSCFRDPAFAANKSLPIHRWVPWIAGFSSEFVKDVLERHLQEPGLVLDPFAGVGTTLIEAALAGHRVVGFEINPYAALACRAKLSSFSADIGRFRRAISRFREFYGEKSEDSYCPISTPPPAFKTRGEFYSPQVLRKVLIVQDFIAHIKDEGLRDLFRVAFAATMITYSNYSYEPSLGQRTSAGKAVIQDYRVGELILQKLSEILQDTALIQGRKTSAPSYRVVNDSFFRCRSHLERGSVDLVITSPPYLNNYHYNRNTRPQMYWLDLVRSTQDMRPLEDANFGKYWQSARELERVDLNFDLPKSDLPQHIASIRSLNGQKGVYGGNGWANYAAEYFNDCHRFAVGLKYALRRGGSALIVIGNSILQGIMIPTDRYLGEIGQATGLDLVDIHQPRATRVGSSIIRSDVRVGKAAGGHQLYEAVVELRRR